jgi:hypothetical protein
MKKYYRNQDPRVITCKFDSVCKETGKTIKRGEKALYYPADKSIFHLDTKQAQSYREWMFDEENNNLNNQNILR